MNDMNVMKVLAFVNMEVSPSCAFESVRQSTAGSDREQNLFEMATSEG